MKKLYTVLLFLAGLFCTSAYATVHNLASGTSFSTIQSTVTSAAPGDSVVFAAGTFGPWTASITIPCGVSLYGPTVSYSQTPNQTATLYGSTSFVGWAFLTTPSCGQPQTIQYLAWNGENPSNGGGFLGIVAGTVGLNVLGNYLYGVNSPGPSYNNQADLIFFGGSPSAATTSNVNILGNVFGNGSDCATAIANTSSGEDGNGGGCGGIGIHGNNTNVLIQYNDFNAFEEPMKTFESQGNCTNLVITQNTFKTYSRIAYETQCGYNPSGPAYVNTQTISFNYFGGRTSTNVQSYDLSEANGCGNGLSSLCSTSVYGNVFLQTQSCCSTGIEIWGESATSPASLASANTSAVYNYIQGYMYNGINWSTSGGFVFNNNAFNIVVSGSTDCTLGTNANGYWKHETNNANAYTPSCAGNTYATGSPATGTVTSAAPALSLGTGTVTSGTVVTITTTGTNRDSNTSNWCTTDGSTPVPGSGTAQILSSLTITSTTTVKCVGMWGAYNQPYSHPANYGYVPSSVVSATYTVSGAVTLSSIALTGTQALTVGGVTSTLTATGTYSNSTTGNVTSTATWASSNTAVCTVSGGVVTPVAVGTCNITATIGAVVNPTFTVTVSSGTTIVSGYLGTIPTPNVNTLIVGQTLQFQAFSCQTNGLCPQFTPLAWSMKSGSAYCSVSATGLVTATAAPDGSDVCAVQATLTSAPLYTSQWNITVSAATLTTISLTTAAQTLTAGQKTTTLATGTYNNGQSQTVTPTSWTASPISVCTIDGNGNITAVSAGTCGIVATLGGVSNTPPYPITINAAPVATLMSLQMSPTFIGTTQPLTLSAVGGFSDGSVSAVAGNTVQWNSSNVNVATVDANGLVTPVGVGSTFITASYTTGTTTIQSVATFVVPSNTIGSKTPTLSFGSPNFGCYVFSTMPTGTHTLVINSDGSFTIPN